MRIAADIKLKNRAKAGMGIGCSILVITGMILEFAGFRAFSSETVMMMSLMLYFMFLQSSSFSSQTKNLEHKATHDGLTGLINRTGYELVIKEFDEEINFVPVLENTKTEKYVALSDSLAFGGVNSVIILGDKNA